MAKATILGFPRIGRDRELKFATEDFWKEKIPEDDLMRTAAALRAAHQSQQKKAGLDLYISNDFSFYDQVLDMSALLGVVPVRYGWGGGRVDLATYFAMARGAQRSGIDVPAAEMTKWFDTNYHYIVPEFGKGQKFKLSCEKVFREYREAKERGLETRPVLIGPVSYLLLGKDYDGGHPLDHLEALLPAYADVMKRLEAEGVKWVQLDEPFLVMDLDARAKEAYGKAYAALRAATTIKLFVTTPFGKLEDNLSTAVALPIDALHIDAALGADQVDDVLNALPAPMILALGVVNGRNIWRNNLESSLQLLEKAAAKIGMDRVWVTSSCSLLHVPYDAARETAMKPALRQWLAFAQQKMDEIVALKRGLTEGREAIAAALLASAQAVESRKASSLIHETSVQERMVEQPLVEAGRQSPFERRRPLQQAVLGLPLFPTTTIGSFPQTIEVRRKRAEHRKGSLDQAAYDSFVKEQIAACIKFQESAGLDVLVHGEFERNDMVEFFGEKLKGFVFTEHGWVQSYGSRGVKPPVIYGDVLRAEPMTVELARYAQSLTDKPVKGMLTGPVTILQWSFVRDDQPRSQTAHQIALALQDEVLELEAAGLKIIQIDEPAFREGLPLRRSAWKDYFAWAVQAFRMASTGVHDETQIHTHMCYSDFNDIIASIKELDADVISIETSRSQMELLEAFATYKYPNQIGPGVYDIHSPRVPPEDEIMRLVIKACERLEPWQVWINPDCGLKTRDWPETRLALSRMVVAAKALRGKYGNA
ncbi:MAG TPA: 5-methyltetrahydropteroyltriglutamate--homocysteine S-methyltransferase [Rhodospirillaceae bacterium]|nr:5-methyltetrahydropteroyltriglutamate--homocysteine S-methyltransferase [Rhodospirillaceae bacterium]